MSGKLILNRTNLTSIINTTQHNKSLSILRTQLGHKLGVDIFVSYLFCRRSTVSCPFRSYFVWWLADLYYLHRV